MTSETSKKLLKEFFCTHLNLKTTWEIKKQGIEKAAEGINLQQQEV